jgi:calcium/calmodulin-dependent protein kinase (CaM kinase) II
MTTPQEIIQLTEQLLKSIVTADWEAYAKLCSDDITAFEAEAGGYLVQGLPFHKHYFDRAGDHPGKDVTTTIASPIVHVTGDAATIAYVRLTQKIDCHGQFVTATKQETRVWHKRSGQWKHVHFHRS